MIFFTIGVFVLAAFVLWLGKRAEDQDRAYYSSSRKEEDEKRAHVLRSISHDVKLIGFVLFAILIMLGVIADVIAFGGRR